MSETEGAAPQAPATPPPSALLAGRFAGIPALEQGIREIHKHPGLGLPPPAEGVPLIGDGRMFKTEKDAEGWYLGMEKLASRGSPKADPPAPPKEPQAPAQQGPPKPGLSALEVPVAPDLSDDAGVMEIAAAAGVDLAQAEAELTKDGTLSAENLQKLKAKMPGLTTKMANEMGASLIKSVAEVKGRLVENAKLLAGGEQQLKTILQFAATLPDPKGIQAKINDIKNPEAAEVAFLKLVKQYEAKHGKPSGVSAPAGNTPRPAPTGEAFKSHTELSDLMRRVNAGDKAAIEELNRRGPTSVAQVLKGRI